MKHSRRMACNALGILLSGREQSMETAMLPEPEEAWEEVLKKASRKPGNTSWEPTAMGMSWM